MRERCGKLDVLRVDRCRKTADEQNVETSDTGAERDEGGSKIVM